MGMDKMWLIINWLRKVRPGEDSSEKNCYWLLTFRQPERKSSSESSDLQSQVKWFKDQGLVPAGHKLKSMLNTQEALQIVKSTRRRLVKARINDCHRRLNYCNNKLQQEIDKLKELLPTNLFDTVMTIADRRTDKTTDRARSYWTRTKTDKTSTQ